VVVLAHRREVLRQRAGAVCGHTDLHVDEVEHALEPRRVEPCRASRTGRGAVRG
jgi:hypothetical protein